MVLSEVIEVLVASDFVSASESCADGVDFPYIL